MVSETIRNRLSVIRESGDIELLLHTLVELSESVPLFSSSIDLVRDWIVESRELAAQCIVDRGIEVRQAVRHAEVLLVQGQAIPAYAMARRTESRAKDCAELGLQDRAVAVAGRALVRLGRHDEARTLLERITSKRLHPSLDDSLAPALCFLAIGEAHLCEGRYAGAIAPLTEALSRLPATAGTARYRWDILMSLAMLEHSACNFESMGDRLSAALELASECDAHDAVAASRLMLGAVARLRAEHPKQWFDAALSSLPFEDMKRSHWSVRRFIVDRLLGLIGARSLDELVKRTGEQAQGCGRDRDLVGYIMLVSLAAALDDAAGRSAAAISLLERVQQRLVEQGQAEAVAVLGQHQQALSDRRS